MSMEQPGIVDYRNWRNKDAVETHKLEAVQTVAKIDKKTLLALKEICDPAAGRNRFFNGQKSMQKRRARHNNLLRMMASSFEGTNQEAVFNSTIGAGLTTLNQGDEYTLESVALASADPNNVLWGIRYYNNVARIITPDSAIALPAEWTKSDCMYALPAGQRFVVENITIESWSVRPTLSCKRFYKDISVYHLRCIESH